MKINPKRLLQIAKKWQTIAATRGKTGGRIRITLPKLKILDDHHDDHDEVKKGHFAVYTAVEERKRFVVPLEFLNVTIFIQLLKQSEEQLGLPCDGPITLPCDPSFLEYLIGLFQHQRSIPEDVEKALLSRKSISFNSRTSYSSVDFDISKFNSSPVANRGHFVVYTADFKRFVLPLSYLEHAVFRELFQKSEEEFGVPCDGPIMVPCDSVFMENAVWRIQKLSPSAEVVKGNKGSFTATTASFSPVASSVRGAGARAFRSRSSLLA
ncbi:Auxin-responsive protein SAUR36 [Linum perenne]